MIAMRITQPGLREVAVATGAPPPDGERKDRSRRPRTGADSPQHQTTTNYAKEF